MMATCSQDEFFCKLLKNQLKAHQNLTEPGENKASMYNKRYPVCHFTSETSPFNYNLQTQF